MSEQLGVKTSYLVMIGNLFVGGTGVLIVSKDIKGAMEFSYDFAKKTAADLGGVLIRKTVEYEVVQND